MPEIRAFPALRYSTTRFGKDWSKLVAPPYDVLDAKDKAALLAGDAHNIVAVDLPFVPPKSAGPDEVYAAAATTLRQWQAEGAVIAEDAPAIYVYHQHYQHGGRSFVRKKFFARMRLEEFGTGTVFPHERTFGGPKEDRLKLMQASRCQMSAVFGLYSDPTQAVSGLLKVDEKAPDVTATMDGVVNHMWIVRDPAIIAALAQKMAALPVYIADGHHRYGTALNYRNQLIERGGLPDDHPARFVLVGFCAMEDAGAVILPTHRVLSGLTPEQTDQILKALTAGMELRPADAKAAPSSWLPAGPGVDVAVYAAAGDRLCLGKFTQRAILDKLAADRTPPYRKLDLAYLHDFLFNELAAKQALGGATLTVQYTHSAEEAATLARESKGIAFITRPCSMAELKAVGDAGDLMPQKSTFFYPKLATGMVVNPLE